MSLTINTDILFWGQDIFPKKGCLGKYLVLGTGYFHKNGVAKFTILDFPHADF
jgi:hypothetical protein